MGKRELFALLNLSSWCLVMAEWLFLPLPWGCLRFVIVVFPDHTQLLFFVLAKSTAPVEKTRSASFHLGLYCLQKYLCKDIQSAEGKRYRYVSTVNLCKTATIWPSRRVSK